jgi:hypothetical protein
LLNTGRNNAKKRKRLNPQVAGANTPNKTCRSNLFVIRRFAKGVIGVIEVIALVTPKKQVRFYITGLSFRTQ